MLLGNTQQPQAIEARVPMQAFVYAVRLFAMVNMQRRRDDGDWRAAVALAQGRALKALQHDAIQRRDPGPPRESSSIESMVVA